MNFIKNILQKLRDFLLYKENDEHEFKPLLTEIEDRPMNPLGGTVFWIIIIFMIIASLWLYIGKVDIVITARGKIIPDGEEKVIKSLDKGVIYSVDVEEGDYVAKGQTLAIIKPAEHEPGLELNNLHEEEAITIERMAAARYKMKIASDKERRLSEVKDIIPKARYDEAVEEVSSLRHEINSLSASLSEVRNKRNQIEKQIQTIKSPIEGYVNTIKIHTIGGVVAPTEELMTVVPKDAKFKIKATVLNQDVGFVEVGMPVSIKIDTFNFQKYGILNGKVTLISPNSVDDERLGPVYEVYIQPENTTLMVEGEEQSIKIGMTTTNEIRIGKRRIIEFFIYPLIKYLDESIKVR
ncbi:MAG: HlyD family efflux transporter periplasmic adaptor subunit [bacterium]|nr:HlyD family efflux transporter periplasmic adaptor subunit [bacterium]